MSRDYAEVERAFIEGLAQDTGRDLAQWMAMIDGQTFAHRNDMIDWLRQQKLTFAKASRLERIHHNGGKPLYGDRPAPKTPVEPPQPPAPTSAPAPAVPAPAAPLPRVEEPVPAPPATAPRAAVEVAAATGDLNSFLAKAKGYRPLAELLMRTIRDAVPATVVSARDTHADLGAPAIYGAIAVTAKDVRLSLDLGDHPIEGDLRRLRLPGTAANLTHTLVINDARKVDDLLRTLLARAAARANT